LQSRCRILADFKELSTFTTNSKRRTKDKSAILARLHSADKLRRFRDFGYGRQEVLQSW
jgi:hypothetical protein